MHDHAERARHWFLRLQGTEPTRRDVLRAAFALAAASIVPFAHAGPPPPRPRFAGYPFTLGVASGYPRADGLVLWTRLAPAPLQPDGGMSGDAVSVRWEVAEDERFARVVRSGTQDTWPEIAHSLRVPVDGLAPARTYWYRFTAGDEVSPVGRTRTAPAADADGKFRLGFASCQHFEHGYFAGHRHLLAEEPDLVAFLGDYIYESSWGTLAIRRHAGALDAMGVADYRVRHAQYKTDPDLARLHAAWTAGDEPAVVRWNAWLAATRLVVTTRSGSSRDVGRSGARSTGSQGVGTSIAWITGAARSATYSRSPESATPAGRGSASGSASGVNGSGLTQASAPRAMRRKAFIDRKQGSNSPARETAMEKPAVSPIPAPLPASGYAKAG